MGYPFHVTVLLMFLFLAPISHADTNKSLVFIKARCAEWRPFVYEEKGKIAGPAYEIAMQVLKHSQHPFDYQLQPWTKFITTPLINRIFSGLYWQNPQKGKFISLDRPHFQRARNTLF